ncbi:MAG: adenylate/guanylate cyclase domain-containing protein [Proteobacteria bacterium]|nr:adenylate/guanylate cyclase domain-containing protein [Pseudomonadota bacterium]
MTATGKDRSGLLRRVRLGSGLVLFAYVASHLANHALGLISLDAMEDGRAVFLAVWRNPIGTTILYGGFLLHMGTALYALYRRRSLRMPAWEWAQYGVGLLVPPLLIEHILGTRGLNALYGLGDSYAYVLLVTWVWLPMKGVQQLLVMTLAWLHGCIGLHFWLRLRPSYDRWAAIGFAFVLLLPVLAALGFVAGGRAVEALAGNPIWLSATQTAIGAPAAAEVARISALVDNLILGYILLVAAVLGARVLRRWWQRRKGVARVSYPGGRSIEIEPGTTVLEASRAGGIAHASVCGGRGRCSTCRIRISQGLEDQPEASESERKVLDRIAAPPNVRLACQLRPIADLAVAPLLPPQAGPSQSAARSRLQLQCTEREIAILFADLRAFTRLSEQKLPYDVVFLLNRYFATMGQAIEGAGGRVDKFIGDGIMALFGVDVPPDEACRQALAAARAMGERLVELNHNLEHDLDSPLRIGIGIHVGPAIVGAMGYAAATTLTAVGDSVNTASRLESMTKELGVELVVSEAVAERANMDLGAYAAEEVEIRGRRQPLRVRAIPEAGSLPTI